MNNPNDDRSMVGGAPDTGVAPGVTGDGDNANRGYVGSKQARPSAMPDPGLHSARDRAEEAAERSFEPRADTEAPPTSTGSEFGKEPSIVKETTDGHKAKH